MNTVLSRLDVKNERFTVVGNNKNLKIKIINLFKIRYQERKILIHEFSFFEQSLIELDSLNSR